MVANGLHTFGASEEALQYSELDVEFLRQRKEDEHMWDLFVSLDPQECLKTNEVTILSHGPKSTLPKNSYSFRFHQTKTSRWFAHAFAVCQQESVRLYSHLRFLFVMKKKLNWTLLCSWSPDLFSGVLPYPYMSITHGPRGILHVTWGMADIDFLILNPEFLGIKVQHSTQVNLFDTVIRSCTRCNPTSGLSPPNPIHGLSSSNPVIVIKMIHHYKWSSGSQNTGLPQTKLLSRAKFWV